MSKIFVLLTVILLTCTVNARADEEEKIKGVEAEAPLDEAALERVSDLCRMRLQAAFIKYRGPGATGEGNEEETCRRIINYKCQIFGKTTNRSVGSGADANERWKVIMSGGDRAKAGCVGSWDNISPGNAACICGIHVSETPPDPNLTESAPSSEEAKSE